VYASEQTRADVVVAREAWRHWAPTVDPAHLVFLDESGVTTQLLRRYGRSLRGTRVLDYAPCGLWQTSTFLAALRVEGVTAPAVFDGPIDGDSFLAYIEQGLAPTLRVGDIVILDNLNCHKVAGVAEAIAARGATLKYLPPYSPDFNPIELLFSKLKAWLCAARCRTRAAIDVALTACLPRFVAPECAGYFRHCGYGDTTRS